MILSGCNFPDEVIDALAQDNLVILAGAGVSYAPKSELPKLEMVLEEAWERYRDRASSVPYSEYRKNKSDLGNEIPLGFQRLERSSRVSIETVRRFVLSKYDVDKEPSELHKAIIRLFGRERPLRLVTTNYDTLLSKEARDYRQRDFTEMIYPRLSGKSVLPLPMGQSLDGQSNTEIPDVVERFEGIAYLHGSVRSAPSDIVLTKKDFADAYNSSDRNAARFLDRLLRAHCILLIGYSCDDPGIDMILTAYRHVSKVYGLFHEDELPKDYIDGIVTIEYPGSNAGDRYAKLPLILNEWIEIAETATLKRKAELIDTAGE